MEGKEKKPIPEQGKGQESHEKFDPGNFLDDIEYYKLCEEIKIESNFFDSEIRGFEIVKKTFMERLGHISPLFDRYEKNGPINFDYLEKKYKIKLQKMGIGIEEIKDFEMYRVENEEKDDEGDSDDMETLDVFNSNELLFIEDYKKFSVYLKDLKPEDLDEPTVSFLDSFLLYLTEGIRKYYDINESDIRLEELMLASRDIESELERLDTHFTEDIFPNFPDFLDYIDAARGGYLKEFREENN